MFLYLFDNDAAYLLTKIIILFALRVTCKDLIYIFTTSYCIWYYFILVNFYVGSIRV